MPDDPLDFNEVCARLDEPRWHECWREDFDRSADYVGLPEVAVPSGTELDSLCRRLGFPRRGHEILVEQRASWDDPVVQRLGAHVQWLVWERYLPNRTIRLGWPPALPVCPLFYAYAALGLAGRTIATHAERGIDENVTARTLWDIGQAVTLHERVHGEIGFQKGWWLSHHLTNHLFRLGRLQFQRAWALRDHSPAIPEGEAFLDVHIPEDGPLSPAACDASFASAPPFFETQFPHDRPRGFACSSWLLDPQLAGLLPPDSNIVLFQRRFELVRVYEGQPSVVFEFVFDRPDLDQTEKPDVSGLPLTTGLERALVDHYTSGGRIWAGLGVIPVESGRG